MPADSNNVNSCARASGTVDWSRPIEAVHEDGRIERVERDYSKRPNPDFYTTPPSDNPCGQKHGIWTPAGASWCGIHPGWRIRNVQPTTPELDPALWDRMEAFVRRWADETITNLLQSSQVKAEAKAIVADLPKPVDPDLQLAREIAAATFERGGNARAAEEARNGTYDDQNGLVSAALDGIRKGRELATPEVSHVG